MGYFLLIPGLLIVSTVYFRAAVLKNLLWVYTVILLIISLLLVIVDLEIYSHWGFRLDATPLLYIGEGTPIAIETSAVVRLLMLWAIFLAAFVMLFKKLVIDKVNGLEMTDWRTSAVMLVLTALMIAPIRGTVGVAPINTGVVYFHPTNIYANHAAINAIWNTGYALRKAGRLKYPGNFLEKSKTEKYFNELYASDGPTEKVLNTDQPNVIIIILESYTYQFLEPLGGIPGVAPNLSKLAEEGMLFTNMYASGDRTDKGIVSILSGYPAQPLSSIIKYPKKTQSLPFLNREFREMGYYTSFTYGGNIDFANFRSYLSNAQFDNITHSEHFPANLNNSKWGVHDEYVFERFLQESNEAKTPFFKVMLSLSSHEPFDVPMETVIEGDDDKSMFLNSAHYTDRALGKFFDQAKASAWWKNTLVVITADHGHALPDNKGVTNPNRFKIPMIWTGGALAKADTVINSFTSQTDIANTILGQLGKNNNKFKFSQNVLKTDKEGFAVYIYNNGFGFTAPGKHIVYDNIGQRYLTKKGITGEADLDKSKAYMQTLYHDFNNR
ncbi:putative sulfatase [Fulvivirga imtechensis AK7]|uniref:Putative sulfatase n=2 Tax=Fulvivirga TaxID=396811 RepID=L8JWX1_9BACT|nr:putative sulfatase [Fulvivirga imtechensis AK7]